MKAVKRIYDSGNQPLSLTVITAISILLAGCQTAQPVPQVVKIPYSIPCLKQDEIPAIPALVSDADLAKLPDFDFVIALATDRLAQRQHISELRAVIQACAK